MVKLFLQFMVRIIHEYNMMSIGNKKLCRVYDDSEVGDGFEGYKQMFGGYTVI